MLFYTFFNHLESLPALGLKVSIQAEEGLSTHFNGLEIFQDRDYIHIHFAPYLDKILVNNGWTEEGKQETRVIEPVHPSSIKELETSEVPDDATAAKTIETAAGFDYHPGIGEIIVAYVTCHLDIGYDVTELSKFSTRPVTVHYAALKRVFHYLHWTRNHGLVYWRLPPGCLFHVYHSNYSALWSPCTKAYRSPTPLQHCVHM
jgi:hypothetical protein